MSDFAVRIACVRMKDGGAEIRVLRNPKAVEGDEDWRGTMLAQARSIASREPLAGFVVLGIFEDGATSLGFRYDPERCPIPLALFPSWLSDVIRRDCVTETEARNVFNEMFEWREG